MNAKQLLDRYERVADAPEAIPRLRRFILDLAVRGKLVPQEPDDGSASSLLVEIAGQKARLVESGVIRKPRDRDDGGGITAPFDIPVSWKWVRLDGVGAIVGGGTPAASDHENFAEPGEGTPWLTPADLGGHTDLYIARGARDLTEKGLRKSSATLMPEGTVLFTSRAPIGYVAIASNRISTNQGFKSIVPYLAGCSRYLALSMLAFASEIDARAPGTTFKEVSGKMLSAVPFPLPPLAEQHRIVGRVDELMVLCDRLEAAREAQEATRHRLTAASLTRLSEPDPDEWLSRQRAGFALDNLGVLTSRSDQIKQLRQTILDLAVRGMLVPQDPNDEPASELLNRIAVEKASIEKKGSKNVEQPHLIGADGSILYDLPEGWAWSDAKNLAQPNELITYGILKPVWVDTGVPTVRVTEMKTGTIDVGTLRRCDPARARKFSKTTLASGDLLISKDGTIGKTAFVPEELAGGNVTQHILRFAISQWVDRCFVKLVIDAPFSQEWMRGETKGVALKGVNVADFRRMPIPVPPVEEQHRIVAKVDELMALCARLETSLDKSTATRSRLLESLLHVAVAAESRELEAAE